MQEHAAIYPEAPADLYEAQLVADAKERSQQAWDEIYNRHYTQVFRYIHARVFDRETAEDLASSVFLGAVKSIGSYQYHGQPLLAWLYRIARNVVSSYQRTHFRQRFLRFDVFDIPERLLGRAGSAAGERYNDPAVAVENIDLREAIDKLPKPQREVLVLKFFVGLDAREIAPIVGKDPSAVYSLQARALQGLRRRLGKNFGK
jgi:RNA polymerase sigma-70 factor (ECF subfamily)